MMIFLLKNLKKISEKLAIQAGFDERAIPITIEVNENNEKMLPYFLRAARLAKIDVNIERLENSRVIQKFKQNEIAKNKAENTPAKSSLEQNVKIPSKKSWKKTFVIGSVLGVGFFTVCKYLVSINSKSNITQPKM